MRSKQVLKTSQKIEQEQPKLKKVIILKKGLV